MGLLKDFPVNEAAGMQEGFLAWAGHCRRKHTAPSSSGVSQGSVLGPGQFKLVDRVRG